MAHPLISLVFNVYIYEAVNKDVVGWLAVHTALFAFSNDILNLRHDLRATQLGTMIPIKEVKIEFCLKLLVFAFICSLLYFFDFFLNHIDLGLYILFVGMVPSTVIMKYFFFLAHKLGKKNYINYEILFRLILYIIFTSATLLFNHENHLYHFLLISQILPYVITSIFTFVYLLSALNTNDYDTEKYVDSTNIVKFNLKNIIRNILSSFLKQSDLLLLSGAVNLTDLSFYKIIRSVFTAIDSLTFSLTRLNLKFGEIATLKIGKFRGQNILISVILITSVSTLFSLNISAPKSLFQSFDNRETLLLALAILLSTVMNGILQVYLIQQFGKGKSGSLIAPQFIAICFAFPMAQYSSGLNGLFIYLIVSYLTPKLYVLMFDNVSE